MLRSERDLEDLLFAEWRPLRESGRFSELLPDCRTRQWVTPRGILGYVTAEYRVVRQLVLPGAWGVKGDGRSDLVELYWSIRTLDGHRDPAWPISFNANVVELKNQTLQPADVEQVFRYSIALRGAILRSSLGDRIRDNSVTLNVKALLLGPEMSEPVELIEAIAGYEGSGLAVARFRLSASGGIALERAQNVERFWNVGIDAHDELKSTGDALLENDELMRANLAWGGKNDGPIYDYWAGLTVHDGRIL